MEPNQTQINSNFPKKNNSALSILFLLFCVAMSAIGIFLLAELNIQASHATFPGVSIFFDLVFVVLVCIIVVLNYSKRQTTSKALKTFLTVFGLFTAFVLAIYYVPYILSIVTI